MSRSRKVRRSSQHRVAVSSQSMEQRVLLSASPIGGVGNNVAHPEWGTVGVELLRKAVAEYGDGISTPAGSDRPAAREVSNAIFDQGGDTILNSRMLSSFVHAWGQFLDHDLDLSLSGTETLSSLVPTGDPQFDPLGTGTKTISTTRSLASDGSGTDVSNPREQTNVLTAYIDGSNVYGSDAQTAARLRTFEGGHLRTSAGNLLPRNNLTDLPQGTVDQANANPFVDSEDLFAAGDVRANENIELTSLHTLFVREHNRQADRLAKSYPQLSDQQLYDRARAIVVGEMQAITYNEFLPALLGQSAMSAYTGYNPNVNPGIANEFSTAAFRLGHTLLGEEIGFLNNRGDTVAPSVLLRDAFFNPELVNEQGIDPIVKFLASSLSSEVDAKVIDSVRNFLFGPPGAGGLDLVSLNILRGRDHGLADYNAVRASYGLSKVTSFAQISSDPELQRSLADLYGSVDSIDLWVGLLSEDRAPGSGVGQTLRAILVDQFTRLRSGDRFWYQNQFSGATLTAIHSTSLSDVIRRNTTITNIQKNVFVFSASVGGVVTRDVNGNGIADRRDAVAVRQAVELIDVGTNEVVATTMTNTRGQYRFTTVDGLNTGTYRVQSRLTTPQGTVIVTSGTVRISRGDQNYSQLNVLLTSRTGMPQPVNPGWEIELGPRSTPPEFTVDLRQFDNPNNQPPVLNPPRGRSIATTDGQTSPRSAEPEVRPAAETLSDVVKTSSRRRRG